MGVVLAQLALFFVPGLIWAAVEGIYGASHRMSGTPFLARAFLYGAIVNALLYIGYFLLGFAFFDLTVIKRTSIPDLSLIFDELTLGAITALTMSVAWLFLSTHRVFMRLFNRLGVTYRLGDSSVWEFLMNASGPATEYAHIRDLKNGLVMCGWVDSFSEKPDMREVLLRDVIVYNQDGDVVSRPPHLYVSRQPADLWVEFPHADREKKKFGKIPAGTVKQIMAGDVLKGGHNGLGEILERPPGPFDGPLDEAAGPGGSGPSGGGSAGPRAPKGPAGSGGSGGQVAAPSGTRPATAIATIDEVAEAEAAAAAKAVPHRDFSAERLATPPKAEPESGHGDAVEDGPENPDVAALADDAAADAAEAADTKDDRSTAEAGDADEPQIVEPPVVEPPTGKVRNPLAKPASGKPARKAAAKAAAPEPKAKTVGSKKILVAEPPRQMFHGSRRATPSAKMR